MFWFVVSNAKRYQNTVIHTGFWALLKILIVAAFCHTKHIVNSGVFFHSSLPVFKAEKQNTIDFSGTVAVEMLKNIVFNRFEQGFRDFSGS